MKEQKLKIKLDLLAKEKKVELWLNESKTQEIAKKLATLTETDIRSVQEIIKSGGFMIKEAIDFSDTDYLLAQIVDIINKK